MEVPLYRERNPGSQETGQITGLSSAPCTCFDCNVLCFLLVLYPPHPPPRIPSVPIKPNCTETMLCCGSVGSWQRCGCSSPEIQSLYPSPPPPNATQLPYKHTHTHTHTLYPCPQQSGLSATGSHSHTSNMTAIKPPDWTGRCYRMWLGIGACNQCGINKAFYYPLLSTNQYWIF